MASLMIKYKNSNRIRFIDLKYLTMTKMNLKTKEQKANTAQGNINC